MVFNQINQVVEFLANIITILGVLIGLPYVYKIYNRIEINFQERNITIGKIDVAIQEKDYSKIAYELSKLREEIYQTKKVGEF
jgi:uncharacterized membrane protein